MDIKVKLSKEYDGKTPIYAKEGDAGIDLLATKIISENDEQIVYDTGFAVEIPIGYVGLVYPRSSIRKKDLIMANSVGVIDSGYRGNIQCTFLRTPVADIDNIYIVGERICQIIIMPIPTINFIPVQKISQTVRGASGHGSTGK
jgi:dUTP pyrophosphatase